MELLDQDKNPLLGKLHVLFRALLVVGAAVPNTTLFPIVVTALFTKRFKREPFVKRPHIMVTWAKVCVKYIFKIDLQVHGKELIRKDTKGYMYVSNHQSYVDIMVLMEALDTVSFLSKQLVRRIPVIGTGAYIGGTIYLERNDEESRKKATQETLRMCEESTAVVIFPEGTRSDDGELRPKIHPKTMIEAYKRGVKIFPVGLHGTMNVVPKAMDRVHLHQKVSVHIAPAYDPADFDSAEAYVKAVWDKVAELHAQSKADVDEA